MNRYKNTVKKLIVNLLLTLILALDEESAEILPRIGGML